MSLTKQDEHDLKWVESGHGVLEKRLASLVRRLASEVERLNVELESVRLFANNTTVIEGLTAALAESQARETVLREALQRLHNESDAFHSDAWPGPTCATNAHCLEKRLEESNAVLSSTSDSSREFVDRIRAETIEECARVVEEQYACDGDYYLDGMIAQHTTAEAIRALLKGTKDE